MPFSRYHGIFNPADLDIINRVFLRGCIDRGVAQNEDARHHLAAEIVALYKNGIDNDASLLAALADRDRNRHHIA